MAFTLIELLVAIGIIAVLMVLSFPVYRGMRNASAMTQCAANLRQIGAAAFQFANDHNGRLLTWWEDGDTFKPFSPRWPQGLAPTLGHTDASAQWTSPILKEIYEPLVCPATPRQYAWLGLTSVHINYAVNCFGQGYSPRRLLQCTHPASTIYLLDGKAIFNCYPALTADIVDPGWPPPPGNQGVYFPHDGKCNAFFLDGHIESFSRSIPLRYLKP